MDLRLFYFQVKMYILHFRICKATWEWSNVHYYTTIFPGLSKNGPGTKDKNSNFFLLFQLVHMVATTLMK